MTARQSKAGWRVGVDVGGTFTDLVLLRADGELRVFKVPSVPSDPAQGVLDALTRASEALQTPLRDLLGDCVVFVHGSTIATNTLLEHKGARVGLLTTRGFRDSLEIRRGIRRDPWRHREPYPPVLVPRYLRLPVAGRLDRIGNEVEGVHEKDVRAAAVTFGEEDVEAVAIAFHNSFLNDAHERRAAALLKQVWKGTWISLSAEVAPVMGEYERTSTAVLNAYIAPRTVDYVRRLAARLSEIGLGVSILLIQNNGGAIAAEQVADRPATLFLSGPAAGAAALGHYSAFTGTQDLISMEIGGTSCDVILMNGGETPLSEALDIEGYDLSLPSIDVHTVGAGGGAIAGVDAGGMLFVGPGGAGANPGPACYGLGGVEPTVTDAQLVLGRLRPGAYAGGAVSLDVDLARSTIENRIAAPLGLSVETAAEGIIRLTEQKLLHALQRISVERGHDPRRFTLVAVGGAGPLHGTSVARALGCRRVYVPRLAGAFCSLGMLNTDVRHDFVRVHLTRLDQVTPTRVRKVLAELEAQGRELLRQEGFAEKDMRWLGMCALRYQGQQTEVRVAMDRTSVRPYAARWHHRDHADMVIGDRSSAASPAGQRQTREGRLPPRRATEGMGERDCGMGRATGLRWRKSGLRR
jgi:N-methylhydantoinase A